MKKVVIKIAIRVIAIFALIIVASSVYTLKPNEYALVKQFGRVVDQKSEQGIYFKVPLFQSVTTINTGERLYDLAESDVITSDKKTMIADCYSTWRVTEPLKFYQTLASSTSTAVFLTRNSAQPPQPLTDCSILRISRSIPVLRSSIIQIMSISVIITHISRATMRQSLCVYSRKLRSDMIPRKWATSRWIYVAPIRSWLPTFNRP